MLPNYQKIMLPFLKILKDGEEYSTKDLTKILEKNFNLTEEEKNKLKDKDKDNGIVTIFSARVAWVRTCLMKAGLIEFPETRKSRITSLGKKSLEENLREIDNRYLLKFNSYREFHLKIDDLNSGTENSCEKTPEENISEYYDKIKNALKSELMIRILKMSDKFFEKLVVKLLLKMGYGNFHEEAGKVIGGLKDGGIDGIIFQDKLGVDPIYIQAKKWGKNDKIGDAEIRNFVGALSDKTTKKGIFITTCSFTPDAIKRAEKNQIILVDGERLLNLMIECNLGCDSSKIYNIKKIDDNFFDE